MTKRPKIAKKTADKPQPREVSVSMPDAEGFFERRGAAVEARQAALEARLAGMEAARKPKKGGKS